MTEILFARKTDVDSFAGSLAGLSASIASIQNTLNAADFVTGTAQGGLGAERVATTSTSIVTTLAAGQISWERAALTGDITAAQNSNATTLATVNANVGTFGSSAQVPTFTVNGKGLITAAGNVTISITASQVTDFTEAAQDAVGVAMGNTTTINHTYNDAGNTITADVNNNSISDTKLRQGIARSVIGVTGNATANVADIQGTADQVLVVNTAGTALAFGTVATGGITAAAVTYAKIQNVSATSRILGRKTAGAGSTEELTLSDALDFIGSAAKGDILYRDTSTWARLGIGSSTNVLTVTGGVPVWAAASGGGGAGTVTRRTISGADTAGTTDKGNLIEVTSGTFTLAFTAAATLTNGWYTYIFNHGTGDVTLDPNGAEQIDGLTSWVLYPGGAILVQTDGSSFHSILLAPMRKQFDANGTFTKPGVGTILHIQAWGGGGSGGRGRAAATTAGGGGGGGGAFVDRLTSLSVAGTTETVTVGAGGAAQTVDGTVGNVGGNTTFGSLVTAFGGGGGGGATSGIAGGGGGGGGNSSAGVTAATTINGGNGGQPLVMFGDGSVSYGLGIGSGSSSNTIGGGWDNGSALWMNGNHNIQGGGGGGRIISSNSGSGGNSTFGGAGGGAGNTGVNAAGVGGNSFWGGGGGGGSTVSGGAGGAGTSTFGGNGGTGGVGAGAAGAGTQPAGGGGGSQNANSGAGGAGRVIVTIW